jgi:putative transcription factor
MYQSKKGNYFCEMCGSPVFKPRYYKVEGVVMILCVKCSKYGEPVKLGEKKKARVLTKSAKKKIDKILEEQDWDLVDNFGLKIREARVRRGLSQEKLAMRIGEPVTFIRKLESGKIRPPDNVIDKLERILEINIRRSLTVEEEINLDEIEHPKKSDRLTLGDVVIVRKKKKKS